MVEKLKGVANLYYTAMLLGDFIGYLREVFNNYRTFKMQLREAELLNINYLDYLINEWQPTLKQRKALENVKNEFVILEDIHIGFPSLKSLMNMILCTNYIDKFGNRFQGEDNKNYRLCVLRGKKRNILIISEKSTNELRRYFFDISGNIINEIGEDELKEAEKELELIWDT